MTSRIATLGIALLAGCWQLDLPEVDRDTAPFDPPVGAPDGWTVERFSTPIRCPDGEDARFYMLYPEAFDPRVHEDVQALPLAILLHSGSLDFVSEPRPGRLFDGGSWREEGGGGLRLSGEWAFTHVFTTLGIYPNYDPVELHAGALPAALAAKGIPVMLPANCWGDLWHNRSGVSPNNYPGDLFFREGRLMAELAWRYATTPYPPSNPVELPVRVDPSRIYLIGLGEGARGVSELLHANNESGARLARPAAAVVDSPLDDYRRFEDLEGGTGFGATRVALRRIFPDGPDSYAEGSFGTLPLSRFPERFGVVFSELNSRLPEGANDTLLDRLDELPASNTWLLRSTRQAHVLSNTDVTLARSIANFLTDGLPAVAPEHRGD